jgi:solute carrier family 41
MLRLRYSLSGVVFENFVDSYKGLALLIPVLNGLTGNLGSIYASRISTALHVDRQEGYKQVEKTLLIMNIPVAIILVLILWAFDLGEFQLNLWFVLAYFVVSMACVSLTVMHIIACVPILTLLYRRGSH